MKTKKIIHSLAVFLAAATILTGCSNKTENIASITSNPTASPEITSEDTSKEIPKGPEARNDTPPEFPGAVAPELRDNFEWNIPGGSMPEDSSVTNEEETEALKKASKNIITPEITCDDTDTIHADAQNATQITLSGTTASVIGTGVKIQDNVIKIKEGGTYVLSGALNGNIIINAEDSLVNIILNGVTITSSGTAALFVKKADKVVITLAEGTENTLTDSENYVFEIDDAGTTETEPTACLYSKSDLSINGTGKLIINGNYAQGIKCNDTLKIIDGTYIINSKTHGIIGKDAVLIKDGDFTIVADNDGIKSTKADTESDSAYGIVSIEGGKIDITSGDDGISAVSLLSVSGGEIDITTGGGSENSSKTHDSFGGRFDRRRNTNQNASEDETTSKGLVCDVQLQITGGILNINSCDDAIHSNSSCIITGGSITLSAGDDGIHSDTVLIITNGDITTNTCYEGLEALSITITGGNILINADDDGMNATGASSSGGGMQFIQRFGASSNASLQISGGSIYVNAYGDGLDSNGSMEISGGVIYVDGPTNGGNTSLDSESALIVSGGIVVAVGSVGMYETPSSSSTQNVISVSGSTTAGSPITLTDADGNVLVSFPTQRSIVNAVISISSPSIQLGSTYTVNTGISSTEVTVSSTITDVGVSGIGGGFMQPDGGRNGRR